MRDFMRGSILSLVVGFVSAPGAIRAQDCSPADLPGSYPTYGRFNRLAYVDYYLGEISPGYWEVIWFIATGPVGGPYTLEISGGGLQVESPAWSPLGTHIAYSDRFRIRVAEVPNSAASGVELTNGPGPDTNPTWSPDESTIAFARQSTGSVCTVPATGGAVTTLWPGSAPAWSPTTNLIAYQLGNDIWLGSPGVGPIRRVIDGAQPAWSPNGQWIAFARTVAGNTDIWAMPVTNGTPVRLTMDPGIDTDPSWARSAAIAYTYGPNADCIRFLHNVPDTTIGIEPSSWTHAKGLYR